MHFPVKRSVLLALLLLPLGCPPLLRAASEAVPKQPVVCVLAIQEDISANTLFLVRRGLREAERRGAAAVILDMDTNGGRVDAAEQIVRLLEHAPMKTYTFVNKKAFSAGAYLAAATDRIYMAPASVIGAAKPIMMIPGMGVQDEPKSSEEKHISAMRALIRTTAQVKGHNPDVFEAMVDPDKELVIDHATLNAKGKLLTLTTDEAAREYGDPPEPLLSAGTVDSVNDLLVKLRLGGAEQFTVTPYGFEVLGRWIAIISPLLILAGFVAIYLEVQHPGVTLPALIAVVCFGLYFLGTFAAGLAGWEEVALFAVGIVLLGLELFVIPGFGVAGVLGLGAILIYLVLALTQHWPGAPLLPRFADLQQGLYTGGGAFGASVIVLAVLGHYLPQTPLFRKLELRATTSSAQGYTTAPSAPHATVGAIGRAETHLRPAGSARFDGELVDVVTEGDLIEKGTSIKIIEVQGSRVLVSRA